MESTKPEAEKDTIPFFPDHVRTELYVTLAFIALSVIIGILGLMFPVGLQEPADPLDTPLHVKSEWYFLFLYQILKITPPTVLGIEGTVFAVVSVFIALFVMALWPFIDRKEDKSRKAIWLRLVVAIIGLLIIIALTVWGELS